MMRQSSPDRYHPSTLAAGAAFVAAVFWAAGRAASAAHRRSVERENTQLRHAAFHDLLTGLPNRAALREELHRRSRSAYVVVLLDVDEFKSFNDDLGHAAGDRVLQTVAARLQAAATTLGGFAARLSGDEFVLLLPYRDPTGDTITVNALRHLRTSLAERMELSGRTVTISTSLGAAIITTPTDAAIALARADAAMYRAKRRGTGAELYRRDQDGPIDLVARRFPTRRRDPATGSRGQLAAAA